MAGPASLFREIHRLRHFIQNAQDQLDRIPRQRKAYQAKLAKAEQTLKEEQDTIKKLKLTLVDREKTLKATAEQVARYEKQFETVTNKKEYDALQLEIAGGKEKCGRLEDEALAAMSESEERSAKLPDLEKAVVVVKQELEKFEADITPRRTMLESEQKQAQAQLVEQEKRIEPDLLSQYNRAVKSQGADAFALADKHICTACNTELIRQMEGELALDRFVMCKSCGRILYPPASTPSKEDE